MFAPELINQNGLFTGTWAFSAFSAKSGERLWTWTVPGNVGIQAPCMTYAVDGRQFVAVAVGNKWSGIGAHGDYIYTFSLPRWLSAED